MYSQVTSNKCKHCLEVSQVMGAAFKRVMTPRGASHNNSQKCHSIALAYSIHRWHDTAKVSECSTSCLYSIHMWNDTYTAI